MTKKESPKIGDRIPVERFHVSKTNVRADDPFGESEEDQVLLGQLHRGKIVSPFKARPEAEGYGVFMGRRRFLAKKMTGTKTFVVGVDCLIEDISEDEAREASLIENLHILRKDMNPIVRAQQLSQIMAFSPTGLRGTARRLHIPASTLSEWLKVLELSPKMQDCVAQELLGYTDALKFTRMKLGTEVQNKLAEVLKTKGLEAFNRELERLSTGRRFKRGIPTGKYIISRITWDKVYRPDMDVLEKLTEMAKAKNMKLDEYCKWVLRKHAKQL